MGFIASFVAGLCSGLGAVGVFFIRRLSPRLEDALLSFAAGIMLAASFFSLILPAIGYGENEFGSREAAVLVVIGGLLLGAGALYLMHRHVPHEHFIVGREGPEANAVKRIWLFVFAITLHNFPEGMAVSPTGRVSRPASACRTYPKVSRSRCHCSRSVTRACRLFSSAC